MGKPFDSIRLPRAGGRAAEARGASAGRLSLNRRQGPGGERRRRLGPRLAMFTVSPKKVYLGCFTPITPANAGPAVREAAPPAAQRALAQEAAAREA